MSRASVRRLAVAVLSRLAAASFAALLGWVFWSVMRPAAAGWLPMEAATAIIAVTPVAMALFHGWRRPADGEAGQNG